jgi:ACR3 family arsenite transporter
MGRFERHLSLWVALAIALGLGIGLLVPGVIAVVAGLELARINLVVAVLIWLMIYPMMLQVDPACLRHVAREPKGLALTLVINWLIKPFTMAALAVLSFRWLFVDLIPAADAEHVIAGMILLGVAPCTAMVFVWSQLCEGDPNYTLVQVSVNDLIMVFAFTPIAGLLLGVTDLVVPWTTLLVAVVLFVIVPLAAGVVTRRALMHGVDPTVGTERIRVLAARLKPTSILGLILTVVLLFAFQAETIVAEPLRVGLIALPLLVQGYMIFAIGYAAAKWMKLPFAIAAPAAMIGTSNFFELAVAVAISLFGLGSAAALATVVGVLIEVPVMLSLVRFAQRTKHWFPR